MTIAPDPGTGTACLRMRGVHKRFGATVALAGVDFTARAGEVLALVGENGAGKSTLMKILAGVHAPDAGSMELHGAPYRPATPGDARAAGVAMIYQELALAPHLTVEENIVLGAEPGRGPWMNWTETRRLALQALNTVGLAHLDPRTCVRDLSLAERQLIEIGRAVVSGARLLVLDEPTSSLAQQEIERLFALIRQLRTQGLAIIYISHFLEEVRAVCDHLAVLRDGQSVGEGAVTAFTDDEIVARMVGRDVHALYPRTPRSPGEVVLSVRNLAGPARAVRASLDLRRGEVVGIAGLIGAGRTEFLRTLFGLDPIRAGTVSVGHFSGRATPSDRWSQGLGLVSEDRKLEGLALDLSIAENITLTRLPRWVTASTQARRAAVWIRELQVKCFAPDQPVSSLSGGNQQKVALARLLDHNVDILLLDEPTRGIDIGAKATLYRLIDAQATAGKAVLIVSSYLPELLGICDRIAVMRRGVLGPARPVDSLDAHAIMLEATGRRADL